MKSDEGFSEMSNKTILIDCLNENVIPYQSENTLKTYTKQNSKTPTVAILLGFFLPKTI